MVEWEVISDVLPYVSRLTVPGGWIYRVHHTSNAAKIVFVPDPVYQDDTTYDRGYEAGARDARRDCLQIVTGTGAAMFSESETAAVDALRADIVAAILRSQPLESPIST